jgi:hypothetical protein
MDEQTKKTLSDEVNQIIRDRRESINNNYPTVRTAYRDSYDWPEMDPLRHEISLCLIFGLNQAAITLTNHMLESLLKNALIIHDSKIDSADAPPVSDAPVESFVALTKPASEKYAANDLGDNINRACSVGLITKDQKKDLHEIREKHRNAYSHSDKEKTFGDSTVSAQGVRLEADKLSANQPELARIADLIFAHGVMQAKQAEREAIPYFLYMDGLVRQIREKIFGPPDIDGGGAPGPANSNQEEHPTT